jgi:CRP-like cAMP-binding protein
MPVERLGGNLERILHLKKAPALRDLPDRDLATLAEHTREHAFDKGALILREGEPVGGMYFVLEGKVRLSRKTRDLGTLGPGMAVGLVGLLAGDSDGFGGVAESNAIVLEIDADSVMELLEDHFSMLRHVMREICKQIIEAWNRLPPDLLGGEVLGLRGSSARHDLDLVERILFLRQGAFANSSINALAELSRGLSELQFEAGTVLWEEGEAASNVLLLASGQVRCSAKSGMEFRAGPGIPLGAFETLAGQGRWYTAGAETRLVALSTDIDQLLDVLEDNFEMALDYLGSICRYRMGLMDRLATRGEDALPHLYD